MPQLSKLIRQLLSMASEMFLTCSGLDEFPTKSDRLESQANSADVFMSPFEGFLVSNASSCGGLPAVTSRDIDVLTNEAASMKQWNPTRWKFVKKLKTAERNFGRIDLMKDTSCNNRSAAVKQIPKTWMASSLAKFREVHPNSTEIPWNDIAFVKHLNRIGFPYVCDHLGVFQGNQQNYIVTSLATDGDLFEWILKDKSTPGNEREKVIQPIIAQIFAAVRWLHDLGIAHGDLSLENIVLTKVSNGTLQIKVIDFGMATLTRRTTGVRGKPSYQAPEMHKGRMYDAFLADAFSLGVVVFTMTSHQYPWSSTKPGNCKQFDWVRRKGLDTYLQQMSMPDADNVCLWEIFSQSFVKLICGLLAVDPEVRMCCGEACFSGIYVGQARSSVRDIPWLEGKTFLA